MLEVWFPQAAVSQTKHSSYQGTSNCLLIILIKLDGCITASDKRQLFFFSTSGRMPQVFYKTLHFLKIYWDTPQTATTTIYQPWSISETSLTFSATAQMTKLLSWHIAEVSVFINWIGFKFSNPPHSTGFSGTCSLFEIFRLLRGCLLQLPFTKSSNVFFQAY